MFSSLEHHVERLDYIYGHSLSSKMIKNCRRYNYTKDLSLKLECLPINSFWLLGQKMGPFKFVKLKNSMRGKIWLLKIIRRDKKWLGKVCYWTIYIVSVFWHLLVKIPLKWKRIWLKNWILEFQIKKVIKKIKNKISLRSIKNKKKN